MRATVAFAACFACACVASLSPAFDARFHTPPDRRAKVLSELGRVTPDAPGTPVFVATTHAPEPELALYDLAAGALRWRARVRAQSRPELLGDLVVTTTDEALVAFDASTGQRRFSFALDGCAYLGSAREGSLLAFTCGPDSRGGGRVVAIDASTGAREWTQSTHGSEAGRPAMARGLVFVPWQRQDLSVLDARDGSEVIRLHARDDVIDGMGVHGGAVFFGQRRIYRLGASGYRGTRDGTAHLAPPTRELPGAPPLFETAFRGRPAARSALGRVAVLARPEPVGEDGLRLSGNRFYLVFYRYVFGFGEHGELLWCRVLEHDSVASEAVPSGIVVLSERGQVQLLGREDGASRFSSDSGLSIASATLDASALAEAPPLAPARGLVESLTEIALDVDTRLVPARIFAVTRLGALAQPEVTRSLLEIYDQAATAPDLRRAVADVLQERRTGLEHAIDALLERYDFLEQTRPAPLSVLARALTAARDSRAVPRLLDRIEDHETPLAALPALLHAVGELGDAGVVAPIASWLRRYRADSTFRGAPEALVEAARVLKKHGGAEDLALLSALRRDGLSHPALLQEIDVLLRAPEPGGAVSGEVAAVETVPALPAQLSQQAIDETFAEHQDELRLCILEELGRNPKLAQVRIAFIAESDGSTHAHAFAPNTPAFVDCLYPKVVAYRFPPFRSGRAVARYVVSLAQRASPPPSPIEGTGPFWSARARSPRAASTTPIEPWWRSHQLLAPVVETRTPAPAPVGPTPSVPPQPPPSSANDASPSPPAQPSTEDAWWVPAARESQEDGKARSTER